MTKYTLEEPWDRLDLYVAETAAVGRNLAKSWIKDGKVLVNNKPGKPALTLATGDEVDLPDQPGMKQKATRLTPEELPLEILFEDDALIVLNKPAGLIVHPVSFDQTGTLVHRLIAHTSNLSQGNGPLRPGIVHRLDQHTEGIMVVAKTDEAYDNLKTQFSDRTVEKRYYAVVKGNIEEDGFTIENFLGRHPKKRRLRAVVNEYVPDAREAITEIIVNHRFGTKTWLDVIPKTGRTHQIRVHLATAGYPILGDMDYGQSRQKETGQLLQAYHLTFDHPTSGERLSFDCPISDRLEIPSSIL